MQALINPTLALIVLGAALLLLVFGVRGVRVDRDPRCRARRCRYPLRALLEAKQAEGRPPWPITCPECGRVIDSAWRAKWGARRKLRVLVVIGALLAAPSIGLLGFEAYAQTQSSRAVASMPVWLLLRQAPNDSESNKWVHQHEILVRARRATLTPREAERVLETLLRLQTDPTVDIGVLADAAEPLLARGEMTPAQLNRFWSQMFIFEIRAPESVGVGETLPFEISAHSRGGRSHNAGLPRDYHGNGLNAHALLNPMGVKIVLLKIGGAPVEMASETERMLYPQWLGRFSHQQKAFSWRPAMPQWNRVRAPDKPGVVSVEIEAEWEAEMFPTGIELQQGSSVTLTELLRSLGYATSGRISLQTSVRIEREQRALTVLDEPAERAWLEAQLRGAALVIAPQTQPRIVTMVRFPHIPWDAPRPSSSTTIFGDLVVRHGGEEFHANWLETTIGADLTPAVIFRPEEVASLRRLAGVSPLGWELVFIPRPERARMMVGEYAAFGGEPIVVPIALEERPGFNGMLIQQKEDR